jgi:hypothetical protein
MNAPGAAVWTSIESPSVRESRDASKRTLRPGRGLVPFTTRAVGALLAFAAEILAVVPAASAQEPPKLNAEELAKANNPLADANALNFQNYYWPSLQGVPDASANSLLFRPVVVTGRQIIRLTLPIQTSPTGPLTYASGLGDLAVFDAILVTPQDATTMIGIGPLLVAPTATNDALGAGKWQAGAAGVVVRPLEGGSLIGALVTWQKSFAGDADRPGTDLLTAQPFLIFQIGGGFYARSSGLLTFDLENHKYLVPIGVGAGKVFKVGRTVVNAFIEPQFTAYSRGDAQPKFQLFAGLNFQWFKQKK